MDPESTPGENKPAPEGTSNVQPPDAAQPAPAVEPEPGWASGIQISPESPGEGLDPLIGVNSHLSITPPGGLSSGDWSDEALPAESDYRIDDTTAPSTVSESASTDPWVAKFQRLLNDMYPDRPDVAGHFSLRSGLAWQDGTPLTPDDVLSTLEMLQNPGVPPAPGQMSGLSLQAQLFSDWWARETFTGPGGQGHGWQDALESGPLDLFSGVQQEKNEPVFETPPAGQEPQDTSHYDDGHSFGWKKDGSQTEGASPDEGAPTSQYQPLPDTEPLDGQTMDVGNNSEATYGPPQPEAPPEIDLTVPPGSELIDSQQMTVGPEPGPRTPFEGFMPSISDELWAKLQGEYLRRNPHPSAEFWDRIQHDAGEVPYEMTEEDWQRVGEILDEWAEQNRAPTPAAAQLPEDNRPIDLNQLMSPSETAPPPESDSLVAVSWNPGLDESDFAADPGPSLATGMSAAPLALDAIAEREVRIFEPLSATEASGRGFWPAIWLPVAGAVAAGVAIVALVLALTGGGDDGSGVASTTGQQEEAPAASAQTTNQERPAVPAQTTNQGPPAQEPSTQQESSASSAPETAPGSNTAPQQPAASANNPPAQQPAPAAPQGGVLSGPYDVAVTLERNFGNHPADLLTAFTMQVLITRDRSIEPNEVFFEFTINPTLTGKTQIGPTFDSNGGTFSATATAPYRGFTTTWVFQGTVIAGQGLSGLMTIGGDGKLPGGQPIIYRIAGTRRE